MHKLFSANLPTLEWTEFKAQGFEKPASGIIHRLSKPALNGMPLGGVDTGCLDLETNGTFGLCSIFNSHVPRRGPLNLPFLGLSVSRQFKFEQYPSSNRSETWVLSALDLKGSPAGFCSQQLFGQAQRVKDIHYWGHYPVADLEFEMDCPVSVGLRAWSPFIPGDVAVSNTPAAVFEVHLRNVSEAALKGAIAFSFPGPSPQESGEGNFSLQPIKQSFSGVTVSYGRNNGYALGVIGNEDIRTGGELGMDGRAWSTIENELPVWSNQAGTSVAVNFELNVNEEKIVRFLLAWYSPEWSGGGTPKAEGNIYTHMYASRYKNALDVAQFVAERHPSLLNRLLAWQQVIYAEQQLPAWLRDSLVNILHLITEDSFWAQAKPPIGSWCRSEDGVFGMNEDPRGCPQIECIPCSFLGNLPLVYFFPELALSTLRAYKAYQFPDGAAPWIFGGCTGNPASGPCEMALPVRGYAEKPQTTLDGACYLDMVERLWLRTGHADILKEFYPSVKSNTIFTMNLRPEDGPRGIISMPSGNNGQDWIEHCSLLGMVSHIGGVHLAQLRMAERMAQRAGDKEFAGQCREWFQQGSEALEKYLWNGKYYLLYHELETGKKSEVIMGCQLDGEWMVKAHGLESAFPPERAKKTLASLKETNISPRGPIIFVGSEKEKFNPGYWTHSGMFVPMSLILAMTYMYYGEKEFGLELARRTMHTIICQNPCSWHSPIVLRADTGQIIHGYDYYQNLVLWFMPAALAGQDFTGPCQPGGLVERIIKAGSLKQEEHLNS